MNSNTANADRGGIAAEKDSIATKAEPSSQNSGGPRIEIKIPEGAKFGFFQRYRKDNYWDSGKDIPPPAGREILRLISGCQEWQPHQAPQFASAWGSHAHAPGFIAALEVRPASYDGKPTLESYPRYTFCYCCDLFMPNDSAYYVVPTENKEALLKALRDLTDPDRGPIAP